MNRLSQSESPYLQQHKNNPVDWFPWGEEAFHKAKEEDKPILVSIGYSSCHWCHVMEEESFEDEETAALMNKLFVNIKVDREEHPAVDNYYMSAVQMLSGSGGWPLNCFLTPGLKPYFGGTYYPPEDMQGRPSWKKVLQRMNHAYRERRKEVEEQSEKLTRLIDEGSSRFVDPRIQEGEPSDLKIEKLIYNLKKELDFEEGGLKNAPKFPSPHIYQFLLSYAIFDKDRELQSFLQRTAHAFIDGGLFDPVHGGFARYCVDEKWRVPHFEKMLYDNAGIVSFLAQMQSFLPHDRYAWAIQRTLGFWMDEMRLDNGLFLSSVDADSEGVEGKFYTWSSNELREELTDDEFEILASYAEVSENGNWEGTNILYTNTGKREQFFNEHDQETLNDILNKLKDRSGERTMPGIDDKVLLDWNAMMITSLFKVARYTDKRERGETALHSLETLIEVFIEDGEVKGHVFKNGKVYADPVLDDYAFVIESLLAAYEYNFETEFLDLAKRLTYTLIEKYKNSGDVLFNQSSLGSESPIGQQPTYFDSPYPCGNSIMADNLRKLGVIYDKSEWIKLSQKMLLSISDSVRKFPATFAHWAYAGLYSDELSGEIAIIGEESYENAKLVSNNLLPGHILMASEKQQKKFPILDRNEETGEISFYLCQNYACQKPVKSIEDFNELKRTVFNY